MSVKELKGIFEKEGSTTNTKFEVLFKYDPSTLENCFFSYRQKTGNTKKRKAKKGEQDGNNAATARVVVLPDDPQCVIEPDGTRKLFLNTIKTCDKHFSDKLKFLLTASDNKTVIFICNKNKEREKWVDTVTQSLNSYKIASKQKVSPIYSNTADFGRNGNKTLSSLQGQSTLGSPSTGTLISSAGNVPKEDNILKSYDTFKSPELNSSINRTLGAGSKRLKTLNRQNQQSQMSKTAPRAHSSGEDHLDELLANHQVEFESEMERANQLGRTKAALETMGLSHLPPPPPLPPTLEEEEVTGVGQAEKQNLAQKMMQKGKSEQVLAQKRSLMKTFIKNDGAGKHQKERSSQVKVEGLRQVDALRKVNIPMNTAEEDGLRNRTKTEKDLKFIQGIFKDSLSIKSVLLFHLDNISTEQMIEKLFRVEAKAGEKLAHAGEHLNYFYILQTGRGVQYHPDNVVGSKVERRAGVTFGDLQLKYGTRSAMTFECVEDCMFWALSRKDYQDILTGDGERILNFKMDMLKSVEPFKRHLKQSSLDSLARTLDQVFRQKDEVILDFEQPIREMIFVFQGKIYIYRKDNPDKAIAKLEARSHFGLISLVDAIKSDFRLVTAEPKTVYFTLKAEEFIQLMGNLRDIFAASVSREKMEENFKHLTVVVKQRQSKLPAKDFVENEIQRVRDTIGILNDFTLKDNSPQDVQTLISKNQRNRTSSLDSLDINKGMNSDVEDQESEFDEEFIDAPPLLPNLNFEDLIVLTSLNAGTFGTVYTARCRAGPDSPPLELVSDPKSANVTRSKEYAPVGFALKVMTRSYISHNGWEDKIDNEVKAMAEVSYYCNTPFILKLYHSFACKKFIYLVIEYGEGGDLYFLLRGLQPKNYLQESAARYYIASVINGLEVLHDRKIMYRDLKPENLILNDKGHLKVADLGLAKKAKRTNTNCGTPDYTAPEIIAGRDHNAAVDWWALGVLVFELHYGTTPFFGNTADEIYKNIEAHKSPMVFYDPKNATDLSARDPKLGYLKGKELFSSQCKDLIAKLLVPKATLRLGYIKPGVSKLRSHAYFQGHTSFSWQKFNQLECVPPFVIDLPEEEKIENLQQNPDVHFQKGVTKDKSNWNPQVNTLLEVTPRIR